MDKERRNRLAFGFINASSEARKMARQSTFAPFASLPFESRAEGMISIVGMWLDPPLDHDNDNFSAADGA